MKMVSDQDNLIRNKLINKEKEMQTLHSLDGDSSSKGKRRIKLNNNIHFQNNQLHLNFALFPRLDDIHGVKGGVEIQLMRHPPSAGSELIPGLNNRSTADRLLCVDVSFTLQMKVGKFVDEAGQDQNSQDFLFQICVRVRFMVKAN